MTAKSVQPYRNPTRSPYASRRNRYCPPAFGMAAPSSANTSAPAKEMMPPTIQPRMSAPGVGSSDATPSGPPVTMKTADPITCPMTSRIESPSPSARTRPGAAPACPAAGAAAVCGAPALRDGTPAARLRARGVVGAEAAAAVGAETAFDRQAAHGVQVDAGHEVEEALPCCRSVEVGEAGRRQSALQAGAVVVGRDPGQRAA